MTRNLMCMIYWSWSSTLYRIYYLFNGGASLQVHDGPVALKVARSQELRRFENAKPEGCLAFRAYCACQMI